MSKTAAVLKASGYKNVYRAGELPRTARARPDTQYGLCLRVALLRALVFVIDRKEDWPLGLILEDGHKNIGDAIRIYGEVRDSLIPPYDAVFNSIAFMSKTECPPLAAADHLVYSLFRFAAGYLGHTLHNFIPAGPAEPPYVMTMPMRRVQIDQTTLAELRRDLLSVQR
jgi:hypothetical protein